MIGGIIDGQARAPGPAEDQPARDAQVSAQLLDVAYQRRGVVAGQAAAWRAAAAAALVEQNDAENRRVEEAPLQW
jgi:hypothetical protein